MTLPEVESRVGLTRGDTGAISQPRSNTTPLEAFAGLTKDLADASFEIVQQRQMASAMREISDMKLRQDARMKELAQNSAPGQSVVEVGMDQFVKEANDFISRQPSYLRDAAREKMLMLRDSTASNLLTLEAELSSEQIALDTEIFSNNTLNAVRFGTMDEATGLADIQEYANSLPPRVRQEYIQEMSGNVKAMSLVRMAEDDPNGVLAALKSGKYNDIDPTKLAQVENEANSVIERREREALARQTDAIEYQNKIFKAQLSGDYATAAKLKLNSDGVVTPTNDQLLAAQRQMGALETQLSLIPEEYAKFYADRLTATRSQEDFKAEIAAILQEYPTQEERNIALNDIKKYNDVGELLNIQIDAAFADNGVYGTIMQNAAYKTMIDPESFNGATKVLNSAAKTDSKLAKALGEVQSQTEKMRKAAILSGADPVSTQNLIDAKQKMAFVAIHDQHSIGRNVDDKIVRRMFDELGTQSVDFWPLNVRKDVADSITEAGIQKAKINILKNKDNLFLGYKENGEPIKKKDNPALWDTMVGAFSDEVHIINASGALPNGENVYYMKDALGVDIIREIDVNGNTVPVILTERDFIEASKIRRLPQSRFLD